MFFKFYFGVGSKMLLNNQILELFDQLYLKVGSRVPKIKVFKKGWNFASSCFVSCFWKNIFFFMEQRNGVFPYIHYEIIFCCAELFECTFNFNFCQSIFIFLNINKNQTSKEQDLNFIRSSHVFWEQP